MLRILLAAITLSSMVMAQESRPESRTAKKADPAKATPDKPPPKPTWKTVNPADLREDQIFRVSKDTLTFSTLVFVLIEQDPKNLPKLEKKMDKVKAGSSFLVCDVKTVAGEKYILCGADTDKKKTGKSVYTCAIRLSSLKGQKIEVLE